MCVTGRRLCLTCIAISYVTPLSERELSFAVDFRFFRVEPSVVESKVLETSSTADLVSDVCVFLSQFDIS